MPGKLSRRQFLKAAGIGVAALASLRAGHTLAQEWNPGGDLYDWRNATLSFNELYGNPPLLGRVHGASWIRVFSEPTPRSSTVGRAEWGFVMPIYHAVQGTAYDSRAQSTVWFETLNGHYVHSAFVVPCHEYFQEPVADVGNGFWGQITVPFVWQFSAPSLRSWRHERADGLASYFCFWSQVHRVVERAEDAEGRVWYRIEDDEEPRRQAWVQARQVRRVAPEEFAPITPDVDDKKIVITLSEQLLTCYENDTAVFQTRIASGSTFRDDEGNLHDFTTTHGDYRVERKRPSRRMRGGDEFGLPYDVNGVPWVTYFGDTGAAIHGAYWHNNFGRPRSHGCINVTPDAAWWIYRWTQPYPLYDADYQHAGAGEPSTLIRILDHLEG